MRNAVARAESPTPDGAAFDLLRKDPVGGELDAARQKELVLLAIEDGRNVGTGLGRANPGASPRAVAASLGIPVVESGDNPWLGPYLRFADYRSTPPEIRLFCRGLATLEGLLAEGSDRSIAPVDLVSIFLAHELYHHIEATRQASPLARRYAVTRLRVGRWRATAPVLALSEIAAGSCAQELLGLHFHPGVLGLHYRGPIAPP